MPKVSLQFIADKAGVSKSLVSKVLNNKEVRVSKNTKDRIIQLAKDFIYIPNRMAAGLRTNKTKMLGCIMSRLDTDFFVELLGSIEHTARSYGYELIICTTQESIKLENKYLELYKSGIMDGLIINPSGSKKNIELYEAMENTEFPFVFVDRYINTINTGFVVTDGLICGARITKELVKRGHKKILFVAHGRSKDTSVQIERYEGYKETMHRFGLVPRRVYLDETIPINKHPIYEIMSKSNRPTALCMVGSIDIHMIFELCKLLNLTIPDDVELGTIDRFSLPYSNTKDMENAKVLKGPPIIFEQDPKTMGEMAVEMICKKIENPNHKIKGIRLMPTLLEE